LTGNDKASGFCVIRRHSERRLKTGAILFISELWRGLYQKAQQTTGPAASLVFYGHLHVNQQQPVKHMPGNNYRANRQERMKVFWRGFYSGTAPVRWIGSDPLQLDVATGR
jgi:hypothetical protein